MCPVYDMECPKCNTVFEVIAGYDEDALPCPKCQTLSKRIISVNGPNCANQDAGWIKTVLEVVDKESNDPVEKAFLKDPTRKNYQDWMKAKGLRPFEPGEKPQKPDFDMSSLNKQVTERHFARKRIEVRT